MLGVVPAQRLRGSRPRCERSSIVEHLDEIVGKWTCRLGDGPRKSLHPLEGGHNFRLTTDFVVCFMLCFHPLGDLRGVFRSPPGKFPLGCTNQFDCWNFFLCHICNQLFPRGISQTSTQKFWSELPVSPGCPVATSPSDRCGSASASRAYTCRASPRAERRPCSACTCRTSFHC